MSKLIVEMEMPTCYWDCPCCGVNIKGGNDD